MMIMMMIKKPDHEKREREMWEKLASSNWSEGEGEVKFAGWWARLHSRISL